MCELWHENLCHIGFEGLAVDRAVEDKRGDDAACAQPGDEGRRLPMPVRYPEPQSLSFWRASVSPSHVGGGPGLIDENKALGVEVDLAVEPSLPPPQDVRALLLGGMRSLFLRVIWWRSKKRHRLP